MGQRHVYEKDDIVVILRRLCPWSKRHHVWLPEPFDEKAAQIAAQQANVVDRRKPHGSSRESSKDADFTTVGVETEMAQSEPVETKGIEPSFRRCDRRVLPLHHVPRNEFHRILWSIDGKSTTIRVLLGESDRTGQNRQFSKLTIWSMVSRLDCLGVSAG